MPRVQNAGKTVLQVGCGPHAVRKRSLHWSFKGWNVLTLDIDERCEPDIVASITNMIGVEDCSVDAICATHVLEHVYEHEVNVSLKEFLRVLKPDGDLLVQMPDLRQACEHIADGRGEQPLYQSPAGPVCAMDMVFGYRPQVKLAPSMMHKTGFTQSKLLSALERAGFIEIKGWIDQYDLFATAQKEKTIESS